MTISRPKVKPCGPNCHCPACNAEWAEYWAEQREIDELVHRDALVREHLPATDRAWEEHPGRALAEHEREYGGGWNGYLARHVELDGAWPTVDPVPTLTRGGLRG